MKGRSRVALLKQLERHHGGDQQNKPCQSNADFCAQTKGSHSVDLCQGLRTEMEGKWLTQNSSFCSVEERLNDPCHVDLSLLVLPHPSLCSPDPLLHSRHPQIFMGLSPPHLHASAHIFPLPRKPTASCSSPFIPPLGSCSLAL